MRRLVRLAPVPLVVVLAAAAPGPPPADSGAAGNRLAGESSPYLLLHQGDPVDWYPWGEAAIAKARAEGKPIFLSIGYATCHWCHVMQRESFSDPRIAERLRRDFVSVKVDREERPDLDTVYLAATELLAGTGGWPTSVFLTPDLEPFYAGTYFPPQPRHGLPAFAALLDAVAASWRDDRAGVTAHAGAVAARLREVLAAREPAAEPPPAAVATAAARALADRLDRAHGGFGSGQKFPSAPSLLLLLDLAEAGDAAAHEVLAATLAAMARGGLRDHLGGGFHRYTTDRAWRVPHFEKMLYDNALLVAVYARWHALTGDPGAAAAVRDTAGFVARELTGPDGELWSAVDAESAAAGGGGGAREEGAFYVWTRAELDAALGIEDAAIVAAAYGVDGPPELGDDRHVLHLAAPLDPVLARRLEPLRARLLVARGERPRPLTDYKVLTDWNGLAIAGLATAGRLLGDPALTARAVRAADFVVARLWPDDGPLLHRWRAGDAGIAAYLADYAYLLGGFLALDRATGDPRWRRRAVALAEEMDRRLGADDGGFWAAAADPDLLVRPRDTTDGALPAASGAAVLALLELAEATGEARFRDRATAALRAVAGDVVRAPAAHVTLARAARRLGGTALATPPDAVEAEARAAVTATARRDGPDLRVDLAIAPGWHLNANPASADHLVPTSVEGDGLDVVVYPPGERRRFGYAEAPIAVYADRVTVRGRLSPGATPATVAVRYQACDDRRCLPPVSVAVPVGGR